eukprot:CCRYP_000795-RA/>CCRYP_000795-RA protein AED:0.34 eAED:0.33 QI:0/0.5/0/1/1/1/3/0/676
MILYPALLLLAILHPSINAIEIKLKPGGTLEEVQALYPEGQISPLFTLPRERLVELSSVEEGLPDLTLWYSITFPIQPLVEQSEEEIAASLESLDSISNVEIPKDYAPPKMGSKYDMRRHLAVTPNFEPNQGYLRMNTPTNNGIDAEYSWTFDGGDGEGVTIYDIEYTWNQQHEDLEVVRDVKLLLNEGDSLPDNPEETGHGTAVLGELVGTSNTFGIKGISHAAKAGMAPEATKKLGSNRANAIVLAVNDGKAGDIILLEMQAIVCGNPVPKDKSQDGYGPAEENQSVFEATQVATGNGITVVAAAGNGQVDLDAANCEGRYDRNIRDSGAVIVGAGGSGFQCPGAQGGAPLEKLDFSTFGSRLDIHGWGECTWTSGYGDAYNDTDARDDENKWYTLFSGTSGASPMVAGAAANIQGIAMKRFGAPLSPARLRQLLTDTGLPQVGDTSKKIGPLVNLRAAIDSLLATMSPTNSPTASPSNTPSMSPTTTPTSNPSNTPSMSPTATPTASPTNTPSMSPTATPTATPTNTPTMSPTATPTASPTNTPTISPTATPTASPTNTPTTSPTAKPTASPTSKPTLGPSTKPTAIPTNAPTTISPTSRPTSIPTNPPTKISPTVKPSAVLITPVMNPTAKPTVFPSVSSKSGKASEMPILSVKSGKVAKSQKADKTSGELI